VAVLDIAVTSIDLDGEFKTQEIFSGLEDAIRSLVVRMAWAKMYQSALLWSLLEP
jgi:hypothetical protein